MSNTKAKIKTGMKGSSGGRGRWEKTEVLKKDSKHRRRTQGKAEASETDLTYDVFKFTYNGFSGNCDESKTTDYTAEFVKWTSDPGIAECKCSDGETRLIPSFALKDCKVKEMPYQPKTGVMFGQACAS